MAVTEQTEKRKRNLVPLVLIPLVPLASPIGLGLVIALQTTPLPAPLHGLSSVFFWLLFSITMLLPVAGLVLLVGGPAALLALAFLRQADQRRLARLWVLAGALAWASWLLGWQTVRPFWGLRRAGLARMTQNARPLINAIEAYHAAQGRYPSTLDDLRPKFIDRIPHTGAVAYPKFRYRLPGQNSRFRSYELKVDTPLGMLNWDSLVYWPERNYPGHMYGGGVERIGDWAYVHE